MGNRSQLTENARHLLTDSCGDVFDYHNAFLGNSRDHMRKQCPDFTLFISIPFMVIITKH